MLEYPAALIVYQYYTGIRDDFPSYFIWALFSITVPLIMFSYLLLCAHAYLITNNITTKEYFNNRINNLGSDMSKFNLGSSYDNISQIFGKEYITWLNPFISPFSYESTDGYLFVTSV